MRHRKHSTKLNRTGGHRKAMFRNMAKSFIINEGINTTCEKAKELKKVVEPLITLAKNDNLSNRRRALKLLGLHFNTFTSKEAREVKNGNTSFLNDDRVVIKKLFSELGPRFKSRPGGYTRLVRTGKRVGDDATMCRIECV